MNMPEIGKIYNCYDDGKISESRRYKVTIKEIIPFKEIDKDTLEQWKEEVKECDFLYEKETDFSINRFVLTILHNACGFKSVAGYRTAIV
jgi:hypothetical protein